MWEWRLRCRLSSGVVGSVRRDRRAGVPVMGAEEVETGETARMRGIVEPRV